MVKCSRGVSKKGTTAHLTRDVAECALGYIGFLGCATGRGPIIFVFSFEGSNSL